jgi:hypothetical protein
VCDAAYLLLVEQVIARTLADRQGAIVAAAMGADVGVLPDPGEEVTRLDEALNGAPTRTETDPMTRMARFLGVA